MREPGHTPLTVVDVKRRSGRRRPSNDVPCRSYSLRQSYGKFHPRDFDDPAWVLAGGAPYRVSCY